MNKHTCRLDKDFICGQFLNCRNKLLFLVFALPLLLLCSCDSSGSGNDNPPEPPPFGWRSAGLTPNRDSLNTWGNGFMQIVHYKDYIFAKDSKINNLREENPQNRIFESRQGTETWREIELPNGLYVLNIYADETGLYVGSSGSGELWHYEPDSKKWNRLFTVGELDGIQSYSVYGMTRFEGRLLFSVAGYDSLTVTSASAKIMHEQPDGNWKNISPPDSICINEYTGNIENPLFLNNSAVWRGNLFVTSIACGLWMYDNVSWQKLPAFTEKGENTDNPFAIALHKDRLYVGDYSSGGVQEVMDDYTRVRVDSVFTWDGVGSYEKTPIWVKTLISTGEHLIVAGYLSALPKVYMGDKGEPKGWRSLNGDTDSWCPQMRCLAQTTYDLDVLNDTLYAAAWEGVLKFPLSDLDSAISTEPSYIRPQDISGYDSSSTLTGE